MTTKLCKIVLQSNLASPNDFGFSAIGRTLYGDYVGTIELDLQLALQREGMSWIGQTQRLREFQNIPEFKDAMLSPDGYYSKREQDDLLNVTAKLQKAFITKHNNGKQTEY